MHVDEFIDFNNTERDEATRYARFALMLFRLPAEMQMSFRQWTRDYKLFCTYEGKRYRCTGASRLGDIWLTSDFKQERGYERRVDVAKCSDWKPTP